jgi:hypothetical protein
VRKHEVIQNGTDRSLPGTCRRGISPVARADDWHRKAVNTFSVPVEIPGVHLVGFKVLPAGTYIFKVLDSQSERQVVQILSQDELTVYATILAIPNYRLKPRR